MSDGTTWRCGRCGIGGLGLPVGHLCKGVWMLPSPGSTVPLAERQRVQAEAAAMRRALKMFREEFRGATQDGGAAAWRGLAVADAALSSSAGRALLEEVEGLRRKVRSLENDVDALNRTCCELNEDLKKAEEKARLGWERAAEKDRAYGEALCERDEAREDAALARDGVVPQRLPYLSSPAEVRRAVEEEREEAIQLMRESFGWITTHAPNKDEVARALAECATAIRARGKKPEK